MTFIDCVTEVRLGHASRMLISTTKTIAEIAYSCGFNNISNFNRRFQQLKGMTPSHYRRLAVQRLTEQNQRAPSERLRSAK